MNQRPLSRISLLLLSFAAASLFAACENKAATDGGADSGSPGEDAADAAVATDTATQDSDVAPPDTQSQADADTIDAGTDAQAGTDVQGDSDVQGGGDAQTDTSSPLDTDATPGTDTQTGGDADATAEDGTPTDAVEDTQSASDAQDTAAQDTAAQDAEPGDTLTLDAAQDAGLDISGTDVLVIPPELVDISLDATQAFEPTAITTLMGTLNQTPPFALPGASVDWGDGVTTTTAAIVSGAPGKVTHQYTQLGTFTVQVTMCIGIVCKTATVGSVTVLCAEAGHDDCSGGIADGCETDLLGDEAHCGKCAIACATDVTACSLAETCETGVCTPHVAEAGTVCRELSGPCDVTETCNGEDAACPEDSLLGLGAQCREAAGDCDEAEFCTGESALCPDDAKKDAQVSCRASEGLCDPGAYCDGQGNDCPATVLLSGTVCRDAEGLCDVPETCAGNSADCPENVLAEPGTVCRKIAGDCDAEETCSGSDAQCPDDGFASSGVCRAAAGPCDIAESCTGTSAECPKDAFDDSGKIIDSGDCGTAGKCDGLSASGGSSLAPAGSVCRPSLGQCDPEELCTGTSTACPPSSYAYYGKLCREASNACDIPEYCGFASPDCPAAVVKDTFGFSYDYFVCSATFDEGLNLSIPTGYCYSGGCLNVPNFYSPLDNNLCTATWTSLGGGTCQCDGTLPENGTGAVLVSGGPVLPGFQLTHQVTQNGQPQSVFINPAKFPGGLRVIGHVKLSNNSDRVAIVTRDGGPVHGVSFWYDAKLQTYGISGVGVTAVTAVGAESAALEAGTGDTIGFDLTDDGNNLSLQVWLGQDKPAGTVTLHATSTFVAYRDAAPIAFRVTNEAFQPIWDSELTDYKVLRADGSVVAAEQWFFDEPPNAGVVLSTKSTPLTLVGKATQGTVGSPKHQGVDLSQGGYVELGQTGFQKGDGLVIALDVYLDSDQVAALGSATATLLSTAVAAPGDPFVEVQYNENGLFLNTAGGAATGMPVTPGTWVHLSLHRSEVPFFTGTVEFTELKMNGQQISFALAMAGEILPGTLILGQAPGGSTAAWPGSVDSLSYFNGADPATLEACVP